MPYPFVGALANSVVRQVVAIFGFCQTLGEDEDPVAPLTKLRTSISDTVDKGTFRSAVRNHPKSDRERSTAYALLIGTCANALRIASAPWFVASLVIRASP
jgi:hypothetical protein